MRFDIDAIVRLQLWRLPPKDEKGHRNQEEAKLAMQRALAVLDSSAASKETLQPIADEYLFETEQLAWAVWQALAAAAASPEMLLRQLHEKKLWYLDILIVQHPSAPQDILEAMAQLPVEILGAHRTYSGYDRTKEIRSFACERTGIQDHTLKNDT